MFRQNNKVKNQIYRGVAQLVARLLWEQDAGGSSPFTPTNAVSKKLFLGRLLIFILGVNQMSESNMSISEMLTYSTVLINCQYADGSVGSGTGFKVKNVNFRIQCLSY